MSSEAKHTDSGGLYGYLVGFDKVLMTTGAIKSLEGRLA